MKQVDERRSAFQSDIVCWRKRRFALEEKKEVLQRIRPPEVTLQEITEFLPRAGVTRIGDVTGLDSLGVPVVMAVRPNSRGISVAQGKGLSLPAAAVSGAMESLEAFHAESISLAIWIGRWSELGVTRRVTDPRSLPIKKSGLFHEHRRIAWVESLNIMNGQAVLVPLETITTDFTFAASFGMGCFHASSNGLASGNSYAEALLHAICEVVERDAIQRIGSLVPRRIAFLDDASDEHLEFLTTAIANAGCKIEVNNITPPSGVPTFLATISNSSEYSATGLAASGAGCHPNPKWACVRAITEAAQSRLTRLVGSRDDLTEDDYRLARDIPVTSSAEVALLSSIAGFESESIGEDLWWILDKLESSGVSELFVVDLTKPEIGVPVLKVVIPGFTSPGSVNLPMKS